MSCARCGASLPPPPYSRRDSCPSCGTDLHACIQCAFYAPGAYNDCREPQAERVIDKETANFCDLFRIASGKSPTGVLDPKDEVRSRLEALFKKKP